ncbi:MAG TPA: hypothetical protein VKV77_04160 [Methylovirgula sp.]|nr:hypothetical protein [Methylovirgula sp.]
MKKWILVAVFAGFSATSALAAAESYYLVKDSVGNCSAVFSSGGRHYPGMKVISQAYSSQAAAREAAGSKGECKESAKPF